LSALSLKSFSLNGLMPLLRIRPFLLCASSPGCPNLSQQSFVKKLDLTTQTLMNDAQLLRYSRHILLDEIGIEGQSHLLASHILIVGAGGLGCPAALYLGSAGVGTLTLIDADTVDATNLQRQIAHRTEWVGQLKVESLQQAVKSLNPGTRINVVASQANRDLLDEWVPQADVVLDCTDNFATRHAINSACTRHRKPLVSGAALRFDGQVTVFDPRDATSPCYACVFPEAEPPEEIACATLGVLAPLVGVIGAVQAFEALKLLSHIGETLAGRLLMLDGKVMQWSEMKLARDPSCQTCGSRCSAQPIY
jgi:molybdopterin-synthase adenylyltransferase